MTTETTRRTATPPAGLEEWGRAQCLVRTLGDDWVRVDLDRWNRRLARAGVPVELRAGGPDGGVVSAGAGYLCRSDLWAAGRRAREDEGAATVAYYMCAAWVDAHPLRGARAQAGGRLPGGVDGASLLEATGLTADPAAALECLTGARGRCGFGLPVDRGSRADRCVATMYLACLDPARGPAVPLDWSAVHAAASFHPGARDGYGEYTELVGRWSRSCGVHPLLVEEWLMRRGAGALE